MELKDGHAESLCGNRQWHRETVSSLEFFFTFSSVSSRRSSPADRGAETSTPPPHPHTWDSRGRLQP